MFKPYGIRIDCGALRGDARMRISDRTEPLIGWAVLPDKDAVSQSAYRIRVSAGKQLLWDPGWITSSEQSVRYAGQPLPRWERIDIFLQVKDQAGRESLPAEDFFYFAQEEDWDAPWIAASEDAPRETVYFTRAFELEETPEDACLLLCGLGYHKVFLNGSAVDASLLDPAYSDYSKTCYYAVLPELASFLTAGGNAVSVCVGEGWRRLDSPFVQLHLGARRMRFEGVPQLSAILYVIYSGVWSRCVTTDDAWQWSRGPLLSNNLYDGCVYDARVPLSPPRPVRIAAAPGGKMRAQTLEPIRRKEAWHPLSVVLLREDTYIVDFGQNLAGFAALRLPARTQPGQ